MTGVGRIIDSARAAPGLARRSDLVSEMFFHPSNAEALQLSVRYEVYLQTGKVVGRQQQAGLSAAMQRVFEDRRPGWTGEPQAALSEVRALNAETVRRVAGEVAGAVRHHLWYLADIDRPVPLPQSRGTSSASRVGSMMFPPFVMSDEELAREGRLPA